MLTCSRFQLEESKNKSLQDALSVDEQEQQKLMAQINRLTNETCEVRAQIRQALNELAAVSAQHHQLLFDVEALEQMQREAETVWAQFHAAVTENVDACHSETQVGGPACHVT